MMEIIRLQGQNFEYHWTVFISAHWAKKRTNFFITELDKTSFIWIV